MSKKNINTKPFIYDIGEIIKTKTGSIQILEQLRLPCSSKNNINRKYYKYKCCIDGYEDIIYENSLNKKVGCKVCGKSRTITGYNDIATICPNKINSIYNTEDAYCHTAYSNKCIDFKCEKCGSKISHKPISTTLRKSQILCPVCNISTCSFGERFMWSLLYFNNIDFWHDCSFKWSKNKRYDFYIPEYNIIIEMNGEQHYTKSYPNGKSIEEEQNNDLFKKQNAINHGIKCYYSFDCKERDISLLVDRILHTDLLDKLNISNVDWKMIQDNIANPIDKQCLELWNNGLKSTIEIGKIVSIHCCTVRNILKKYAQIGECDYDSKQAQKMAYHNTLDIHYHNIRPVICLNNLYIFNRMIHASKWCGSKKIYKCCQGKAYSAGKDPISNEKLRWKYLNDYLIEHPEIENVDSFINKHLFK